MQRWCGHSYKDYGDLESCLIAGSDFAPPPNHLSGEAMRLAADLIRESFGVLASAGGVGASGCKGQYWCGSLPLG